MNVERWAAHARGWSRALYRWMWRLWRPLMSRDDDQLRVRAVCGIRFVVLPGVFDGARLRTGAFLAETLNPGTCPPGARALDLGTGSGIGAIVAARYAAQVIATDINPQAVRCARLNALAHHLEERIEGRVGDLFEPVRGERFELILFNPPYFRGRPRDFADCPWRSPDVFDRFLRELPAHLTPGGRALVVLSTDGDIAAALSSASHLQGWQTPDARVRRGSCYCAGRVYYRALWTDSDRTVAWARGPECRATAPRPSRS